MKLFLDSGDLDEIQEAYRWGVIDGITSNPKLIQANWKGGNREFLKAIGKLGRKDTVIVTLESHDPDRLVREAKEIAAVYPDVVIKLYMTKDDLAIIKELKKCNIAAHVSLIYSVNQAFLAAKAGAAIVSPFIGRADDFGCDGIQHLKDILRMVTQYGFDTEVMAASIRHPYHVREAILCGTPIVTLPFPVLEKMFHHPATDVGVKDFLDPVNKKG
jgi:transaldolase